MNNSLVPRRLKVVALVALCCATIPLYFSGQRKNPPGFYTDESSIAYNAFLIAEEGKDEHGFRYPLYFRAFGEYKNPVYIYLLAGVFKVVNPGNLTARRFSAILGYLAATVLGLLAFVITQRPLSGIATFLIAIVTPCLFEISRLSFEVAAFPLALALFLLAARLASTRSRWPARIILSLIFTLVLINYVYSIGRLYAPLLAGSLFLFYTRERRGPLAAVLIGYGLLALLPTALYNHHHSGALTSRFKYISYLSREGDPVRALVTFEGHYVANLLPLALSLQGDPNPRHHVPGSGGSILLMTFVLAAVGGAMAMRSPLRDRWWWFVVLTTLISVIPASLTDDLHHSLRLVPYPILLIVLGIPAFSARGVTRLVVLVSGIVGLAQASFFFHRFHSAEGTRLDAFDGGYRHVVNEAAVRPERPIWIDDNATYAHAFWYGSLRGLKRDHFVTGKPPSGGLMISEHPPAVVRTIVARRGKYTAYIAE